MTNYPFCIDHFPANLLLFSPVGLRREASVGEKAPGFFGPDDPEQVNGTEGRVAALDADDCQNGAPVPGKDRESAGETREKGAAQALRPAYPCRR